MTKCSICHNDTNQKDGTCVICRNIKFKLGNSAHIADTQLIPARRSKTTKKHQGTIEGGKLALSSSQNPYLLDDLQLLILAQVGYIFDLAKEGKLKQACKRIKITSEALKNATR